ncbi:MAG: polyhydroxyalkanoic acid system family protein [Burkholderiaceae bacterium]|nr:polyhydroxyalkanoic acid system family protein [Burkholderiaceae bacterium]
MPDISISQKHKLPHKKAKAAAQKVADKLAEEYGISSEWDGDVLNFKRTGVSGRLEVSAHEAHLHISLGFMLKMFAATIEEQVHKNMKKVFTG